jgi:hypothetical protein
LWSSSIELKFLTNIENIYLMCLPKSLVDIFTNIRRYHLQSENMGKLIFVSKNWPNDTRASCKSPNDLVEFIEMDEQLKEELQEFEGEFEWDEI